jgi:predicted nucleotidyltransferase
MVQQSDIDKLIEEIVLGYAPEKVYLFGSYPSGTETNDSDIRPFYL